MKARLIPALLAVAVTAVIALGWLNAADNAVSDALYQRAGPASRDIVVVGIDQVSLDTLGPMPWPRNYMAEAITFLNNADPDARPAVIGIDVLYTGENRNDPVADAQLANAAAQYGNVVVASAAIYGNEMTDAEGIFSVHSRGVLGWDAPYEALKQAADTGHINAMADTDGILRHALLYVDVPENGRLFSFARVIYERWCEAMGEEPNPCPETTEGGFFYLPFSAAAGAYCDGISFLDLLDGDVDPAFFRDRIVLIGPYASGLQDAYPTSLDHALPMFGVEIQANGIEAFQKGFYPREVRVAAQVLILLAASIAAALFFWERALRDAVIGWLAACLGWVVLCWICYRLGFVLRILWVPVAVTVLFLISAARRYIHIRDEKRRISAELDVAAGIQKDMLPDQFPPFPEHREFSLHASMTPAKAVGGDLFDFFLIDGEHLGLVIGDVSGKGVPAALLMTVAMVLIRDHALHNPSPAEVLREVNNIICSRNDESMFVTAWLGVLELSTGKLTAASAGHEYPILRMPGEPFQLFKDRHGLPLGAMEGSRYREYELILHPASTLFVYTDGLPEAINSSQEQFGPDRAVEVLNEAETDDPAELIRIVHEAVDRFAGTEPQFDDLTLLSLTWHGTEDLSGKTAL